MEASDRVRDKYRKICLNDIKKIHSFIQISGVEYQSQVDKTFLGPHDKTVNCLSKM